MPDFTNWELPQLVAHQSALHSNIATMAEYCLQARVSLAPHAKTTMSEQLINAQLAAGAWGMTAATPRQVRTLVDLGLNKIILANTLVDLAAIRWIAETFLGEGDREFCCYVDSVAGVELLQTALAQLAPSRPLPVLLEVGVAGGRTGARDLEQARVIADAVAHSPALKLVGVAAFEGVLVPSRTDAWPDALPEFLILIRSVMDALVERGQLPPQPIVTAGGSAYFDAVVEFLRPAAFSYEVQTILRSGCYVSHDHGLYHRTSPFDGRAVAGQPRLQPALELLASVWSQPEPGLIIAGFGRRDVPIDDQLPVVLGYWDQQSKVPLPGWKVQKLWDQHAAIAVPVDASVPLGTVLSLGISHPCGAFDRWREIPVVAEDYAVLDRLRPLL